MEPELNRAMEELESEQRITRYTAFAEIDCQNGMAVDMVDLWEL